MIALLHDIGRFEQLTAFNSFDDRKFNHADFGVKVLFEDGMIRDFLENNEYDEIIRKAIQYHSLYQLPEGLNEKEKLHCQIIRDADKLDNFRVKETCEIETLLDITEEELGKETITEVILETVRNHQCIVSSKRVTHLDCWVSYLAFIFDLNFKSSFRWILERDYLNRNIKRVTYTNSLTIKQMKEVGDICNRYIQEQAK